MPGLFRMAPSGPGVRMLAHVEDSLHDSGATCAAGFIIELAGIWLVMVLPVR